MVAPEYRYPDNETVPEYLRGKTASDAAQLVKSFVEQMGRGGGPPPPPPPVTQPADDDYVTGAQIRLAQQQALNQVSPWLQSVADQQANMSYSMVKQENGDLFKKYEPEIIQTLNSVPRANWTLDVIRRAVTMVKGSHVDEIVAERQRALESTMFSTMRSTGRAGSGTDFQAKDTIAASLEKTPEAWRMRAQMVGITDRDVADYCKANDMTPDDFFKQFEKGLVTDAVAEIQLGGKTRI